MLYVSDRTLYSIRSDILRQWSVLRTGVMWWCFGVLVTAWARAFRTAWRRFMWVQAFSFENTRRAKSGTCRIK